MLGNGAGLELDVHAFTFDANGDGVYGPPEHGAYYRADALTLICPRNIALVRQKRAQ